MLERKPDTTMGALTWCYAARNGTGAERAAIAGGMRTLWDDGLDKVLAGLTSVEELARVVSA